MVYGAYVAYSVWFVCGDVCCGVCGVSDVCGVSYMVRERHDVYGVWCRACVWSV